MSKSYFKNAKVKFKKENFVNVKKCDFCGGELIPISIFDDEYDIKYVKCANCHAITFNKILNDDSIQKLYENYHYYDTSTEAGGTGKITFGNSKRFAKHLHKCMGIPKKKNIYMLDLGGGSGELAAVLAETILESSSVCQKIEITVIDYYQDTYKPKDSRIIIKHQNPPIEDFSSEDMFDIVIASAVIEHIAQPGSGMKKLFSVLAPGGSCYFRTPAIYPIWKLLKQFGIKIDNVYPEHIWDLGEEFWNKIPKLFSNEHVKLECILSKPSIVECSFRESIFITIMSYLAKVPWYICRKWKFIGGWEAIYKRKREK